MTERFGHGPSLLLDRVLQAGTPRLCTDATRPPRKEAAGVMLGSHRCLPSWGQSGAYCSYGRHTRGSDAASVEHLAAVRAGVPLVRVPDLHRRGTQSVEQPD